MYSLYLEIVPAPSHIKCSNKKQVTFQKSAQRHQVSAIPTDDTVSTRGGAEHCLSFLRVVTINQSFSLLCVKEGVLGRVSNLKQYLSINACRTQCSGVR